MNKAKSKKIRDARIIATNIFMGVMVVIIVFLLMFVAMGYNFNEEGELDQSGLVQIFSTPSNAVVEIDGNVQFSHTTINKMLTPGKHEFKITKNGYDNWYASHDIESGLLTRIDWVRLFPINPEISESQDFLELDMVSYSPSRKYLLAHEKNSKKFIFANIQGENLKINEIKISDVFGSSYKATNNYEFSIERWNNNDTRAIITAKTDEKSYTALANLDQPELSINLTTEYGLNFTDVLFANDAGSKLWAIEDGKLHAINTSDKTIGKTIAHNIKKAACNRGTIAYIASTDNNDKLDLYIFKDEEANSTKIDSLDTDSEHQITMGTYWNEDWIAYSDNSQIIIKSGRYPSAKKDDNTLKTILERELEYNVSMSSTNYNERLAVLSDGKNVMAYDIETKNYYDSVLDTETNSLNWLDSYILWEYLQDKIVIRDFDGANRREILTKLDNHLPIAISDNNKWLYYFEITEIDEGTGESKAAEDAVKEDADTTDNDSQQEKNEATIHYILKREKLTI